MTLQVETLRAKVRNSYYTSPSDDLTCDWWRFDQCPWYKRTAINHLNQFYTHQQSVSIEKPLPRNSTGGILNSGAMTRISNLGIRNPWYKRTAINHLNQFYTHQQSVSIEKPLPRNSTGGILNSCFTQPWLPGMVCISWSARFHKSGVTNHGWKCYSYRPIILDFSWTDRPVFSWISNGGGNTVYLVLNASRK